MCVKVKGNSIQPFSAVLQLMKPHSLLSCVPLMFAEKQQSFEESFQDLQLSVNECFENPESRSDVETNVHRLSVRPDSSWSLHLLQQS